MLETLAGEKSRLIIHICGATAYNGFSIAKDIVCKTKIEIKVQRRIVGSRQEGCYGFP